MAFAQSQHHGDLAFAARLAGKVSLPHLEDDCFQSAIANFMWNLTDQNLEDIQAALSYPFSKYHLCQMLTSIVESAATTVADLLPKLCETVGLSPSAVVNSTSSSIEDVHQDRPAILKVERLAFWYSLDWFFGITVESVLDDCMSLVHSLGEGSVKSSELVAIVVEDVVQRVNMVLRKNMLKINLASSPCFLYFCPDDSCIDVGQLLIRRVLQKLSVFHCFIPPSVAATAIITVLAAIHNQLPSSRRQSLSVDVTSSVIEYITEDIIHACGVHTWESGAVPVLRPAFQSTEGGPLLLLLEPEQPSCSTGAKTTTLFDSLMTALYKSKSSRHVSALENDSAASDRLHQRLADLMNCVIRLEKLPVEEIEQATKDFLHHLVVEVVQLLFVRSTFPRPANLPENTPVMPFVIKVEDFGLTVVDHMTELVVSQVFDLLLKKFPATKSAKIEPERRDVSIQEQPPKLTFKEKMKKMKSNILRKLKRPFRSKKDSVKVEDAEATAESPRSKKKSLFGFTVSFSVAVKLT